MVDQVVPTVEHSCSVDYGECFHHLGLGAPLVFKENEGATRMGRGHSILQVVTREEGSLLGQKVFQDPAECDLGEEEEREHLVSDGGCVENLEQVSESENVETDGECDHGEVKEIGLEEEWTALYSAE